MASKKEQAQEEESGVDKEKSSSQASDLEAAAACLTYAACSISLSLFNKQVFSGATFNFPISVLAFQSICAIVLIKGADILRVTKPVPVSLGALLRGHCGPRAA